MSTDWPSLEHNAIRRFNADGVLEVVVRSSLLKWPDSFSVTPDGEIYVSVSQLHIEEPAEPYRIFRLNLR